MPARILVTGGAGFLGRHLVHALLREGFDVRVFDRQPFVARDWPTDHLEYIQDDIRSRPALTRAFLGIDAVCHLAGTPQLWAPRRGLFDAINYRGTMNVLEEAVANDCGRILHVSSAAIWPTDSSPRRLSAMAGPYCRSKLRAEIYALELIRQGLPITIASPTLPIGPGDFLLTPPTQMLLDFCVGARRETLPASVNLIDVRDLAQALMRALLYGDSGKTYLLGNQTVALADLVTMLGHPRPTFEVPFSLALGVAHASEWWAYVWSGTPPLATLEGVRLTRRPMLANVDADLRRLGVLPRPLDHTLADVVAWFRHVGWLGPSTSA
jgi:dihydroflavonol-4-reductase